MHLESLSLASRRALVTGGSRGIGRACAVELARRGADVAITYASNQNAARQTVEEIEGLGRAAVMIQADLSHVGDSSRAFNEARELLGPIDILVLNAGTCRVCDPASFDIQDFDYMMHLNVRAPMLLIQEALRGLQDKGKIVAISSSITDDPPAGSAAYAASKAALEMVVRAYAPLLASRGICCNVVSPGFVETDLLTGLPSAPAKEVIAEMTMLKRVGVPQDIAEAVAFLSSPAADYITGSTLKVTGGL